VRVPLENRAEGLPGIGGLVLLQEKLTRQQVRPRILGIGCGRIIEGHQRIFVEVRVCDPEVPDGRAHGHEVLCRQPPARSVVEIDEGVEEGQRRVPLPSIPLEDPQVEPRGRAIGSPTLHRPPKRLFGLRDPALGIEGFPQDVRQRHGHGAPGSAPGARHDPGHLIVAAHLHEGSGVGAPGLVGSVRPRGEPP